MNIKEIRDLTGFTQEGFSKAYGIPLGTLHHWELEDRKPPEYVLRLLRRCVEADVKEKAAREKQKKQGQKRIEK